MKILVIDAYTDGNIGSGALIENSVMILEKVFPGAEIEMLSQFPEYVEPFSGVPNAPELITMPFNRPRLSQLLWLFSTASWMALHAIFTLLGRTGLNVPPERYTSDTGRLEAIRMIRNADLVVSIGAERINDNFYKAILFSLYTLWMVQLSGKKLVLFPQTIGPFHFRITRFLSKIVLDRCAGVFLRDRKSAEIVEEMGVICPVIVDSYDVAVLQKSISPEDASRLLSEKGVPSDVPIVGISAMKWSYVKASGKSGYDEYCQSIARVADELVDEKGVEIVFVATNVPEHGCREDDIEVAREICAMMKNRSRAHVLDRLYSPSEMKGIFSRMEMCLVTRMHACILASGICTPVFSINYQFKLHEYMKLLGLGEHTVDIDKVTYDNLKKICDNTWSDRDSIRRNLEVRIPEIAASIWSDMGLLKGIANKN